MRESQTCVGCAKKAPDTETNYTLISAQFGWRLSRQKLSDGGIVLEWRCPACWQDYKRAKGTVASKSNPPPAAPPSEVRPRTPPPASSSESQRTGPAEEREGAKPARTPVVPAQAWSTQVRKGASSKPSQAAKRARPPR